MVDHDLSDEYLGAFLHGSYLQNPREPLPGRQIHIVPNNSQSHSTGLVSQVLNKKKGVTWMEGRMDVCGGMGNGCVDGGMGDGRLDGTGRGDDGCMVGGMGDRCTDGEGGYSIGEMYSISCTTVVV